mgnify:CR=1 FL=1
MFKKAHIILCIYTMIKDILRFTILPVNSFSLALVESELWPDTAFKMHNSRDENHITVIFRYHIQLTKYSSYELNYNCTHLISYRFQK